MAQEKMKRIKNKNGFKYKRFTRKRILIDERHIKALK